MFRNTLSSIRGESKIKQKYPKKVVLREMLFQQCYLPPLLKKRSQ
jgi:hypothetical protein